MYACLNLVLGAESVGLAALLAYSRQHEKGESDVDFTSLCTSRFWRFSDF